MNHFLSTVKEKGMHLMRPEVAAWAATQGVAIATAIVTAFLLAGCGYSGIHPQSQVLQPAEIADSKFQTSTATNGTWPNVTWWTQYGDAELNAVVEEALHANPSLKVAQARLEKANAVAGLASAASHPNLAITGESSREKFTRNYIYPPPLGGATLTTDQLGLNFSWELDFWGKNSRAIDAAHSQVLAAQADHDAARLALTTAVTRAWFSLERLYAVHDVIAQAIQQREDIVKLTQQRVAAGLDTNVELRQAEALVPTSRVELSQTDEAIALVRNQIAALLGAGPDRGLDLPRPSARVAAGVALPATLSADLMGRRPDLVAARWRVEAAKSDIGVAKAQFYPNINLIAAAGLLSLGNNVFLHSTSQDEAIGPALSLPLFQGALRANLRGKDADYDAAVEQYNATLIDAFRDVADQIVSLKSIETQRREQALAREKTEQAYALATQRYQAGLGNYLTVLTAETAVLAQRRAETDLNARVLDLNVSLVRALGGGYNFAGPALAQR